MPSTVAVEVDVVDDDDDDDDDDLDEDLLLIGNGLGVFEPVRFRIPLELVVDAAAANDTLSWLFVRLIREGGGTADDDKLQQEKNRLIEQ